MGFRWACQMDPPRRVYKGNVLVLVPVDCACKKLRHSHVPVLGSAVSTTTTALKVSPREFLRSTTVTDLANVSHEPLEPDPSRRPLRRAHRYAPDAFRAHHARARASTDRPGGRHRAPYNGLDGAAVSQCLPKRRGARVSPARSRCSPRWCRDQHRRHAHPSHSNRAAVRPGKTPMP